MAAVKRRAKYGKGAQEEVENEMRRYKRGTAKSGKSGAKVKSRKQAIAIALSKARKKGKKVPKKPAKSKSARTAKRAKRKSPAKSVRKKRSA